jgi:hypothetical protein
MPRKAVACIEAGPCGTQKPPFGPPSGQCPPIAGKFA